MTGKPKFSRALLEQAVSSYSYRYHSHFKLARELSRKQIVNALDHIAAGERSSSIVALMDETLADNGKKGFLITDSRLYFSKRYLHTGSKTKKYIDFSDMTSIQKNSNGSFHYLYIVHADGSSEGVECSIFQDDIYSFFSTVLKLHAAEEEKAAKAAAAERAARAAAEKAAAEKAARTAAAERAAKAAAAAVKAVPDEPAPKAEPAASKEILSEQDRQRLSQLLRSLSEKKS